MGMTLNTYIKDIEAYLLAEADTVLQKTPDSDDIQQDIVDPKTGKPLQIQDKPTVENPGEQAEMSKQEVPAQQPEQQVQPKQQAQPQQPEQQVQPEQPEQTAEPSIPGTPTEVAAEDSTKDTKAVTDLLAKLNTFVQKIKQDGLTLKDFDESGSEDTQPAAPAANQQAPATEENPQSPQKQSV